MLRRNVIGWIILAGLLPLVLGGAVWAVGSQTVETTADVEVTVWKHVESERIYLSTRPADGQWTTHNTAIDLSTLHPQFPSWYQGSAVTATIPVTVTVDAPDAPDPEPEPGDLTLTPDMEWANAWVHIQNGRYGWLTGSVKVFTDMEAFDLDVHVVSGTRAVDTLCNRSRIRSGIYAELGCSLDETSHAAIDTVWLEWSPSYGVSLTYSCIRHNTSDADESVWACLLD